MGLLGGAGAGDDMVFGDKRVVAVAAAATLPSVKDKIRRKPLT